MARMVLACARPTQTPAQRAAVEVALAGDLDWALVARLALRHRMVPLVQRHLAPHGDTVPAEVSDGLLAFTKANHRRAAVLVGQLALLQRRLSAAGINAIALKGPALAQVADRAQGLRTISDLDLLIAPTASARAEEVMRAAGFALISRSLKDDVFQRAGDGLVVEMHHRLSREPGVRFEIVGDVRPEVVQLAGQHIQVLPLTDNLLFLAYHGAKHCWSRLSWLSGFAGALEQAGDRLDLVALAHGARATGIGRSFELAVVLARDALQSTIPAALPRDFGAGLEGLASDLLHAAMTETQGNLPTGDGAAAELLHYASTGLLGYIVEGGAPVHGLMAIEARLCPVAAIRAGARISYVHRLRQGAVRQLLYSLFLAAGPLSRVGPARRRDVVAHAVVRPFKLVTRWITVRRRSARG